VPRKNREDPGGGVELLAPLGALLAVALPFFVLSLASAETTREAKLAAQAGGAVLVLAGLALTPPSEAPASPSGISRFVRRSLLAALTLFVASFAVGLVSGRDPLDALPLLSALALAAWGATRAGESASGRSLDLLVVCGAATGVLAALQRFAGLLRLPVEAPEPRFFATALIGNPGDVGAALVIPALLAASWLAEGRRRFASALALACCVSGLAAAATLAPLAAFVAGAAVLVSFDLRRRLVPALAAAAATVVLLAGTGVLRRAAEKVASGDVTTLTTQRDIGVLAALETIRSRPLLGTGPGGVASDFVRARLAAEERTGRRLVHLSPSAHFDNAHSDPLTVAAEAGLPAALAFAATLVGLLAALTRAARREKTSAKRGLLPAEALLASLAAILVLSLANFPIQIVPVSGPFALLAGLSLSRAGGTLAPPEGRGARTAVAAAALLLFVGAALRFTAARSLGRAETALSVASSAGGGERRAILDAALEEAARSVSLRPRHAPSLLALGSARAAGGELDLAVEAMEQSLSIEERAETLLNLGRLALARRDPDAAHPLFVRAVWILPRLLAAIPADGDPQRVFAETARLEAALPSGGAPPPLPERLRRR
jgi:O-antigen ligase